MPYCPTPTTSSTSSSVLLHRQDDHLVRVVDDDEVLQPLVRHVLPLRHEPPVDALVRERVEEVLEERLVADLDRPQVEVAAGVCGPVDLELLRVLAALARDERLVLVDEVPVLRLAYEPGPELRVRDRHQLHGALADVLAVQVGDAVLGDHVVDVAADQRDARALGEARARSARARRPARSTAAPGWSRRPGPGPPRA